MGYSDPRSLTLREVLEVRGASQGLFSGNETTMRTTPTTKVLTLQKVRQATMKTGAGSYTPTSDQSARYRQKAGAASGHEVTKAAKEKPLQLPPLQRRQRKRIDEPSSSCRQIMKSVTSSHKPARLDIHTRSQSPKGTREVGNNPQLSLGNLARHIHVRRE